VPIPVDLLHSLKDVRGFDEAAFKAVHDSGEQVTSIRLNPAKSFGLQSPASDLPSQASGLHPIPWCPHGFYLDSRPSFTLDPLFHGGAYYVQDASSMFLWHLLSSAVDPQQHKLVLDLCAAPGGKSTLLSSLFPEGLVVSNEVIRSRANILQENVTKWGTGNFVVTNNDSKDFKGLEGFFDVIVADVPCSGSGLFRKDPSAIEEWSPDNVNLCCQRQQRILADIIPCLAEDGVLVYSTCSYSKEEDEDILDWIIDTFNLQPISVDVPASWGIIESRSARHAAPGYRFFPDKVKGEGFFIAAFRQTGEVAGRRYKESALQLASAKETSLLSDLFSAEQCSIFKHGETFHLFPSEYFSRLKALAGRLFIRQAGIAAGSFKGKSFVPEHALALSTIPRRFPFVEVDKNTALSYLRKQDVNIIAEQGWNEIRYQGLGLGWIKALPNRVNNYYPSEWRILKS
jgi:16S rRNA C967 or C1407 C5-methylase (RsmB/RsmF family)/NOL1/NOP2/fmu family ribosome biogenesis protein